ncbi:MAG: riboflavin synthase [Aquificaceae bacterium]|nr:riboflavin synthase [Aquificaceae bacterium]MDW8236967.1 riboflavin synthase [Aquificaceae bacterium]
MFTGLIESIGKVISISQTLIIESSIDNPKVGESIAVNGVCLTLVEAKANTLSFNVSTETLKRSNLSELNRGDYVNLERALKVGDRLGGHFVQGHVDFKAKILDIQNHHSEWLLKISYPKEFRKFFVFKGSVAIDGISLTINSVRDSELSFTIIPHTFKNTNLSQRRVGQSVNVEIDILSKLVVNAIENSSNLDSLLKRLYNEL